MQGREAHVQTAEGTKGTLCLGEDILGDVQTLQEETTRR